MISTGEEKYGYPKYFGVGKIRVSDDENQHMVPAKSKITDGTYSSVETMNPLTDAIKIGAVPEKILADEYPRNNIWASQSAQDLQNSGQNLPENNQTFFDDGLAPTTFNQLLFGCSSRTTHLDF